MKPNGSLDGSNGEGSGARLPALPRHSGFADFQTRVARKTLRFHDGGEADVQRETP